MLKATQVKETQVKKLNPAFARADLGLTQQELADRAGTSQRVISNSENGFPIRLLTAAAILRIFNEEREKRGLAQLELEDVDWIIR